VPGLANDHVTVVDQSGAVLNPDDKGAVLQAQQLDVTRQINQRYEAMITELLVPVLGRGNFRVTSDADIDFSQTKESLVRYGESHVLSQEETTHSHGVEGGDQAIGIPGALSNRRPDTPTTNANPAPPPQPQQQQQGQAPAAPAAQPAPLPADTHKTTNYDIDKTVQFLERPTWTLRGINVAVVVNNPTGSPIPAERLQSINKLTASAIGAGQNSHVTVVDLPFEVATDTVSGVPLPWWRAPWMEAVGQNALLAMAGLLALFGGVFPLLRRLAGAQMAVVNRVAAKTTAAATAAAAVAAGQGPHLALTPNSSPQDVFSIEAETVQSLVTNDPARTAQVIRGWIAGDRSSLR
jgi:flagellar M-ring protein FliF